MIKNPGDLDAWERPAELAKKVYFLTKVFPREDPYGLVNPMRKCADSILSNIAQGRASQRRDGYIQCLCVALGSCTELEALLARAEELGYATRDATVVILKEIDHIGSMLRGLIKDIREPDARGPAPKVKGATMIIVVFMMMLFAVLGAVLASLQSVDFESSKRQMQSARAFYLADSGLEHALQKLFIDAGWRTTGETYNFSDGQYTLSIEDNSEGSTEIISTSYTPAADNFEAKRVLRTTALGTSWINAVTASYLFDWSAMHSGSEIEGSLQARFFDGDDDNRYNEVGQDYASPPNALPPPSTGYTRKALSIGIPDVNMTYYRQKAQEIGRYVDAPYVYVAGGSSRYIYVINNNVASPTEKGKDLSTKNVYDAHGYFLNGANYYTCMAIGNSNPNPGAFLAVEKVTNPASPVLAGTTAKIPGSNSPAYGVFTKVGANFAASYAYLAAGSAGLAIVSISNPNNPSVVGTYKFPSGDTAYGVYVLRNYAYVAYGATGLEIVNVATPASPVRAGGYNTAGTAYNVYVRGRYAYVADGTNGLVILNVSNPASPTLRATVGMPGTAYGVYVKGLYAYVACGTAGLRIVDISNLANSDFIPKVVGNLNTENATDIHISGYYAYVADNTYGLHIIDVTNPRKPASVSRCLAGEASGVFVLGDKTFSGSNNNAKVWYTRGNILIDVTATNANILHTSLIAEGDIEIIGTYSIAMRAHVDRSIPENFATLASEDGSVVSVDELANPSARDFDGLLYSKKSMLDFNYLAGCALMASYIFFDGVCDVKYLNRYVGNPPNGFVTGVTVTRWQEQY